MTLSKLGGMTAKQGEKFSKAEAKLPTGYDDTTIHPSHLIPSAEKHDAQARVIALMLATLTPAQRRAIAGQLQSARNAFSGATDIDRYWRAAHQSAILFWNSIITRNEAPVPLNSHE